MGRNIWSGLIAQLPDDDRRTFIKQFSEKVRELSDYFPMQDRDSIALISLVCNSASVPPDYQVDPVNLAFQILSTGQQNVIDIAISAFMEQSYDEAGGIIKKLLNRQIEIDKQYLQKQDQIYQLLEDLREIMQIIPEDINFQKVIGDYLYSKDRLVFTETQADILAAGLNDLLNKYAKKFNDAIALGGSKAVMKPQSRKFEKVRNVDGTFGVQFMIAAKRVQQEDLLDSEGAIVRRAGASEDIECRYGVSIDHKNCMKIDVTNEETSETTLTDFADKLILMQRTVKILRDAIKVEGGLELPADPPAGQTEKVSDVKIKIKEEQLRMFKGASTITVDYLEDDFFDEFDVEEGEQPSPQVGNAMLVSEINDNIFGDLDFHDLGSYDP